MESEQDSFISRIEEGEHNEIHKSRNARLYKKQFTVYLNVLPVMIVKSKDFQENEQRTIEAVMQFAGKDSLAVRSSSSEEDTIEYSNAGKF